MKHARDMTNAEFAALKREVMVNGPVKQAADAGMARFWARARAEYPDLELPA